MPQLKILILVAFCLTLFSHASWADSTQFEVSVGAELGSASDSGFIYGLNGSLNVPLSRHIEFGVGGYFFEGTRNPKNLVAVVYAGPTYNFSEEWERSFYLGLGLGHSNHYPIPALPDSSDPGSLYGYARFGKRFLLSENHSLTFSPYVEADDAGKDVDVRFEPLNFSVLF